MYFYTSSFKSSIELPYFSFFILLSPVSCGNTPEKVSLRNLLSNCLSIFSIFFIELLVTGGCRDVIDEKWDPRGFYKWIEPLKD